MNKHSSCFKRVTDLGYRSHKTKSRDLGLYNKGIIHNSDDIFFSQALKIILSALFIEWFLFVLFGGLVGWFWFLI